MRRALVRTTALLFLSLTALSHPACGKADLRAELVELLREKAGKIESLTFTCRTEDGEKVYGEEFHLRFPDEYRYRFLEERNGEMVPTRYAAQSGNRVVRARLEGSGSDISLQAELLEDVPPIRGTGVYLSLYHMMGNADYYYSLLSMLEGGSLSVVSLEDREGRKTYHLRSAEGLSPETEVWLETENGLPLRRELVLEQGRRVVFSYGDLCVDPPLPLEPFPESAAEIAAVFGRTGSPVSLDVKDGACRLGPASLTPEGTGFSPLLPELEGFEEAGSFWRDPAASDLSASERSLRFPEGFREFYLLLRQGSRQAEIREVPRVEDFGYYTSGLGLLSGAYLVQQERFPREAADASYTVTFNRQEMQLVAGEVEITVTGDLSRQEYEELARTFQSLAEGNP